MSYSQTVVTIGLVLAVFGAPSSQGAQRQAPRLEVTAHWMTFADTAIGGASSMNVVPSPTGPSNEHPGVKLEGELKRKFAFPYFGAQAFFQPDQKPQDMRASTGI